LSTEFKALINEILGVLYAPHKAFKKIAENPKYLGVAVIITLFVALQVGTYYNYFSRVNFEQTSPAPVQVGVNQAGVAVYSVNQFAFDNATQWVTSQGTAVTQNFNDFINQTYYGNNSLQFAVSANNLSAALIGFGTPVNCGSNGFQNLSMSIKQTSPSAAPEAAKLILYTSGGTSSYYQLDVTSMLSSNVGEWNNLTLPVGTSQWQSTGSANWSDVTGLKLEITYSSTSNITVLMQGIFFHGQYTTQVNALGTGAFIGYAAYSVVIQALLQWIILAAMSFLILKGLKAANVTWRPIFIATGFVLAVLIITSTFQLISTLTLPTVYLPYDFPPSGSLVYPDAYINAASSASQVNYQAILAATATYRTINTAVTIIMYVWQAAVLTFAVKAVSGLSYVKSLLTAIGAVVLTLLILTLLSYLGFV
jgi:hypothetical protein